jgi:hypothetical protein
MTRSRSYATAGALRIALEERLKRIAGKEGIDLQRLRRQVAFDRLLARIFSRGGWNWALKGGYAMELRLREARTTKDIDLTLRDLRHLLQTEGGTMDLIRAELQECAGLDLADYFVFLIGESIKDIDAAPYGGARYPVDVRLDGRAFIRFHVDVGAGDAVLEPLEIIKTRDWLAFAGVYAPEVALISREQQLAEKLHAYTLPNRPAPNSRVKDLVDIALLIERGNLDHDRVRTAIEATFKKRRSHPVPERIQQPDSGWSRPFATLASGCGLDKSLDQAFELLQDFFDDLIKR